MARRPSGMVTFLFTDVQESTRMWEEHSEAMRFALARHDEILHAAIESHRGLVFSTAGDGLAAAFDRAGDAVSAALVIQRDLTAEPWPEPIEMRVRCGLHTGEADERGGDYFGRTVNRAARVMAAANGGQTVVTSATVAMLDHAMAAMTALTDLGLHRLRGIDAPVHLFGVTAPGEPWSGPPLATFDPHRVVLPSVMTNFIGRSVDVSRLAEKVTRHRLVTLTGVGGIGKTRLAIEVARRAGARFGDGVRFVELAPLADDAAVVDTVATVLGVRHQEQASLADAIIDWLGDQRLLLVIDNAEHVLTAASHLVERIGAERANVAVMVTSRAPLNVAGEVVWRVPPLDPKVDGAELFVTRAASADAHWELDDDECNTVTRICERLDGVPLAIELAAARMRSLTAGELLERLDDQLRLLRAQTRTAPERQKTLRATIAWSYQLLGPVEQRLFDSLSVFAAGFDLEGVEAVWRGEHHTDLDVIDLDVNDLDVIDVLSGLVDQSMVLATRDGPRTRYRLLESLRRYGEERLAETGQLEALRTRHLDHYVRLATTTERLWESPNGNEGSRRFRLEWDNLRAAHSWSVKVGDLERAVALVDATMLWSWTVVRSEHRAWAEQTLHLAAELQTPAPSVWGTLAGWARIAGDHAASLELAECGIAAAAGPTDSETLYCWDTLVATNWDMGRYEDAARAIPGHRATLDRVEDPFRVIGSLATLSVVSLMLDPDAAPALITTVRKMAREHDSPRVRLYVAWATVLELLVTRQPREALHHISEALAIAHAGEMWGIEGQFHAFAAMALSALDDDATASRAYSDALTQLRSQRNWEPIWWTLEALALDWIRSGAVEPGGVVLGYLQAHDRGLGFFSSITARRVERLRSSQPGSTCLTRGAQMNRDDVLTFALDRLDEHGGFPSGSAGAESVDAR